MKRYEMVLIWISRNESVSIVLSEYGAGGWQVVQLLHQDERGKEFLLQREVEWGHDYHPRGHQP